MPIPVQLGTRSYDVHVGPGLLANLGDLARATTVGPGLLANLGGIARPTTVLGRSCARVTIIADSHVPSQHIDAAARSCTQHGLAPTTVTIPGGEACKTLANAEHLLQQLAAARHERTDPVIAIGGGALCDLAGFVAATYRRGVPIIHCPTTLLAMVDASVGGKTGVNLTVHGQLKKNIIGAFWQPAAVIADIDTLHSLPPREVRAGLAECLKHGLIAGHIGDDPLWDWSLSALSRLQTLDPAVLTELIERNVRVKAAIVAGDEREEAADAEGGRALLNLGHTFGHVIESLTDLLHGECVALGLIAASTAAAHLNVTPPSLAAKVAGALRAAGLPITAPALPDTNRLIDLMCEDKKTLAGDLRIIVPLPNARAAVVRNPGRAALEAGWHAIRTA